MCTEDLTIMIVRLKSPISKPAWLTSEMRTDVFWLYLARVSVPENH